MLKIGDFSKLSRISIRMLRYYDENDVLKPAYIDEVSGYRFYEKNQIFWAAQIRFFKDAGFGVSMMKEILAHFDDAKEMKRYILLRLVELQEERTAIEETIIRLKKAEELLYQEDKFMQYKVELKEIPGMNALSTRGVIPRYDREDLLWKKMNSEIIERNLDIKFDLESPSRSYYYDEGYIEKDVDVEVCVGVVGTYENSGNLKFRQLPTETCACVRFKGEFNQITDICVAISIWVNEHGYTLGDYNFCIYHVCPGPDVNPKDYMSEVCFPIHK